MAGPLPRRWIPIRARSETHAPQFIEKSRDITERLIGPNTVAAYRDAFKLLLVFAQQRTGKPPSKLEFADLDAPLIGAFLEHLEAERGNSTRTHTAHLGVC